MKFRMLFSSTRQILVLFSLVVLVCLNGNAQQLSDDKVPARATQAFSASQPGASATWRQGPGPTYEAFFSKSGKSQVYVYDVNGSLQLKKLSISKTTLPGTVQNSVAYSHAGQSVEAAYKVISRTKERFYEVQVATREKRDYLRYGVGGNLLGNTSLALVEPATTRPTVAKSTPTPAPAPTMAMRGESSSTVEVDLSADINLEDEMMDDDIKDLLDDSEDFDIDSLDDDGDGFEDIDIIDLDEEDDWEDIDPFF